MAVTWLAAALLVALLVPSPSQEGQQAAPQAEEPTIDHQPVECSSPAKNPRVCAYVLDDGEVKRVRVYFRAARQEAFYWSEMAFDGIQFCATLPVAKKNVETVEYYIWAVDDQVQVSRTRSYPISLSPAAPCAYPVIDEEPARISNLIVHATSEKQGREIQQFEKEGIVEFVSLRKK